MEKQAHHQIVQKNIILFWYFDEICHVSYPHIFYCYLPSLSQHHTIDYLIHGFHQFNFHFVDYCWSYYLNYAYCCTLLCLDLLVCQKDKIKLLYQGSNIIFTFDKVKNKNNKSYLS